MTTTPSAQGVPTSEEILAEAQGWLAPTGFNIDMVTGTDLVLTSVVDAAPVAAALGPLTAPLKFLLGSSTNAELTVDVNKPDDGAPSVDVRMTCGRHVRRAFVVNHHWWPAEVVDHRLDSSVLLRRAAAAAVVMAMASLYRTDPRLHGITDPRVLFLLDAASHESGPKGAALLARAAAHDPNNLAVRFALLAAELRGNGNPDDDRLMVLHNAFYQLAEEVAKGDVTLRVRARYASASCAINMQTPRPRVLDCAYRTLCELATDAAKIGRATYEVVALAKECAFARLPIKNQRRCYADKPSTLEPTSARGLYNLACYYALKSEVDLSLAALGAAIAARPSLARAARNDHSLDNLLGGTLDPSRRHRLQKMLGEPVLQLSAQAKPAQLGRDASWKLVTLTGEVLDGILVNPPKGIEVQILPPIQGAMPPNGLQLLIRASSDADLGINVIELSRPEFSQASSFVVTVQEPSSP